MVAEDMQLSYRSDLPVSATAAAITKETIERVRFKDISCVFFFLVQRENMVV